MSFDDRLYRTSARASDEPTAPPPAPAALPVRDEVVRQAVRDGEVVATTRCRVEGLVAVVECEVQPTTRGAELQTLGPYRFQTLAQATAFADDLMLALEYLGCALSESSRPAQLPVQA